ncbi:hypothetical protein [Streptomyces sp. NPDC053048]|uniref:hypothetical protein n=1 Tax=Streptomyces sp. NPDC053048 TaxID=3365694 RepID=UPI0037D28F84
MPMPPASEVATLLSRLHALPAAGQVPEIARWARRLSASGGLGRVLDELWAGGDEERSLAVDLARTAHHVPLLERALTDGGTALRRRVLGSRELPRLDVALVVRAVRDTPADDRVALYRRIRRRDHRALAEALREPVRAAFGTGEEALLLPACEAHTVRDRLPELWDEVRHWRPLTLRHPDEVLAELHRRASPGLRGGPSVGDLARRRPAAALEVAERRGIRSLRGRDFLALAQADATRAVRLLCGALDGFVFPGTYTRRAVRAVFDAEPEAVRELVRAVRADVVGGTEGLYALLRAAPASCRGELYEVAHAERPFTHSEAGYRLVRLLRQLPREHREREARRIRARTPPNASGLPALSLSTLLPLADVRDELSGAAADGRTGLDLLVECAAHDAAGNALDGVLAMLAERLPGEHVGVRAEVLTALAGDRVPERCFRGASVPALERLVAGVLDAPDADGESAESVSRLAGALLGHRDPAVAAFAVRTLRACWLRPERAGHRLSWYRTRRLREAYAELEPAMTAAARKGHFTPAMDLAWRLGPRAEWTAARVAALHSAVRDGTGAEARRATHLLLAGRRTRGARFQQVLDLDPDRLADARMRRWAEFRRPELLDGLWEAHGVGPAGFRYERDTGTRAGTGEPYRRWAPAQRERYAALLARNLATAKPGPLAHEAARELGRLFRADPGLLGPYLDSPHALVARAAVGALPFADRPEESLRRLVLGTFPKDGGTSSERGATTARVMTSIRRCLRRIPPSRRDVAAGEALRALLTSWDEVADPRWKGLFLGPFAPARSAEVVVEVWAAQGHRSEVSAACAWLARHLLHEPRIWSCLREAVRTMGHRVVHELACSSPDVRAEHRHAYAGLLIEIATGPDARSRRCALTTLGSWGDCHPGVLPVLAAAAVGAGERAEWQAALGSLAACAYRDEGEDQLADVLDTLATAATEQGRTAAPDGPRHRLAFAVDALDRRLASMGRRAWSRPVLLRLAERLRRHPGFALEALLVRTSTVHGLWRAETSVLVEDVDALIELAGELERALGASGS